MSFGQQEIGRCSAGFRDKLHPGQKSRGDLRLMREVGGYPRPSCLDFLLPLTEGVVAWREKPAQDSNIWRME